MDQIDPTKSELFGDIIAPVVQQYENPIFIAKAYRNYMTEMTKPVVSGHDDKGAPVYNAPKVSTLTPEQFQSTGVYKQWIDSTLKSEGYTGAMKGQWGSAEALAERAPFSTEGVIKGINVMEAVVRLQSPDTEAYSKFNQMVTARETEVNAGRTPEGMTEITPEMDKAAVENYLFELTRPKTTGEQIAEGVSALPKFMVEVAATWGIGGLGGKVTQELAEKALKSYVKKKVGQFALKLAYWGGASATQATVGFPLMTAENIVQRETLQKLDVMPDEPTAVNVLKGYGDTVIEIASERSGEGLTKGAAYLLNKLPLGKKLVGSLQTAWMAVTGGTQGDFIRKLAAQGGYSNILGELGEERLGTVLRAVTDVDDFGAGEDANPFQRLWAGLEQDIKQLPVELAVLATPMVPGMLKSTHGLITKTVHDQLNTIGEDFGYGFTQQQLNSIQQAEGIGVVANEEQLAEQTGIVEKLVRPTLMGDKTALQVLSNHLKENPELVPVMENVLHDLQNEGVEGATEALAALDYDKYLPTYEDLLKRAESGDVEAVDMIQGGLFKGWKNRRAIEAQNDILRAQTEKDPKDFQEAMSKLTPEQQEQVMKKLSPPVIIQGDESVDSTTERNLISRFRTKVLDQSSMEHVGRQIAVALGVTDAGKIKFNYLNVRDPQFRQKLAKLTNDPSYVKPFVEKGGIGGFTDVARREVTLIVGSKIWEMRPGESIGGTRGQAGLEKMSRWGVSQSVLKRILIHELGHIASPPKVLGQRREAHHKDFAAWVNAAVDKLWSHKEGDVYVPGKQKVFGKQPAQRRMVGQSSGGLIGFDNTVNHEDSVNDYIAGGGEVQADNTISTEVSEQEAVDALKIMLEEGGTAAKDRKKEERVLRAKQYALINGILGDASLHTPEDYARALGSLKDITMDPSFAWTNPISEAVYQKLCGMIASRWTGKWKQIDTWKALTALRNGESLTFYQKQLISRTFGLIPAQIPDGGRPKGYIDFLIDIWNLPRMLLAGFFDNSLRLRQEIFAFVNHPITWAKAVGVSMKAMFMPKYFHNMTSEIYQRPNFELYQLMGLDITDMESSLENTAESNIGGKLLHYRPHRPNEGKLIKAIKSVMNVATSPYRASMRAADLGGNVLRANIADIYINSNRGILDEHTEEGREQWKILGQLVNRMTGRTNLAGSPSIKKVSAVMAPLMFSLQLHASRIAFLTTGLRATSESILATITRGKFEGTYSPTVRRAITNSFLKMFFATATTLAVAALLWPEEVSVDPEESRYGKVKIGNTYYDLTAGLGQYVRYTAQMITGKKKSITGNRYTIGRGAITEQFLRSKAAPALNMAWDLISGRKVTGEPVDWTTKEGVMTNLWNYMGPMIMQDTADVIENDPYQVIPAVLFAFFGGGMQSYPVTPSQTAVMTKKKLAVETYGKDWDQLGPDAQKSLYLIHPELEMLDRQVAATRSDWNNVSLRLKESQLAGKEVLSTLPENVQKELISMNLTIGGLGRQVGSSSYFLNEAKYETYKNYTSKILNKVLPTAMASPQYAMLNQEMRYKLLEAIVNKSKQIARNVVYNETKQQDLVMLQELNRKAK